MSDWQEVSLYGGPFDGHIHLVDPERKLITIRFQVGSRKQAYGDAIYDVPLLDLASYRRVSDSLFQHCRTPTCIGDTDLQLPERQLGLEEDL